jgi:adenylosuccinate lyase
MHGRTNDLLTRLRGDEAFAGLDLESVIDPSRYVGRAPQQVDDFLRDVVQPIRQRYRQSLGQMVELKV